MDEQLLEAKEHFAQGISRISNFWGFPKALGAIYAAIYLAENPLSLDEIARQAGISKGAASIHVRNLERLKVVQKEIKLGDRKDYYVAQTDFWDIVKNILKQREQPEFDQALSTVSKSLALVEESLDKGENPDLATLYKDRMMAIKGFFDQVDRLVALFIVLDNMHVKKLASWLQDKTRKNE